MNPQVTVRKIIVSPIYKRSAIGYLHNYFHLHERGELHVTSTSARRSNPHIVREKLIIKSRV